MKRISLIVSLLFATSISFAQNIPYQEHTYQVKWKWGIIELDAATAFLTFQCDNGNLNATMHGSSIAWEGRVYSISDTLQAQMQPNMEKVTYCNGWYTKPKTGTSANLNNPSDYRTIMGQGSLSASPSTMEAVDITANMLSLYYYATAIDFDNLVTGHSIRIPITASNGTPQSLDISYQGVSPSPFGEVYNIIFNYSYLGAPSAYPVTCQIAKGTRLPVFFSADIHIGHVEMTLQ